MTFVKIFNRLFILPLTLTSMIQKHCEGHYFHFSNTEDFLLLSVQSYTHRQVQKNTSKLRLTSVSCYVQM